MFACNSLAMSALGRGNMMSCKELLERAFEVANDDMWREDDDARDALHEGDGISGEKATLLILTLNNAACLQRRCIYPSGAYTSIIPILDGYHMEQTRLSMVEFNQTNISNNALGPASVFVSRHSSHQSPSSLYWPLRSVSYDGYKKCGYECSCRKTRCESCMVR